MQQLLLGYSNGRTVLFYLFMWSGAQHEKFALLDRYGGVPQEEMTWPSLSSFLSHLFTTALSAPGSVKVLAEPRGLGRGPEAQR